MKKAFNKPGSPSGQAMFRHFMHHIEGILSMNYENWGTIFPPFFSILYNYTYRISLTRISPQLKEDFKCVNFHF